MTSLSLNTSNALSNIVLHAAKFVPYYRDQEWAARLRKGEPVDFQADIPLTPKDLVKEHPKDFYSTNVNPEDGETIAKYTSGSTGRPLEVRKTSKHFLVNERENKRLAMGWDLHQHDSVLQVVYQDRAGKPSNYLERKTTNEGKILWVHYGHDTSSILSCLVETSATRLSCMASVLYTVLELARKSGRTPNLRLACTFGEVTAPNVRVETEYHFGLRVFDTYGAVETGLISARCAVCGDHHIADRHVHVEILTTEGLPAKPGDIGRVYITPLYNAAMPLLRYQLGDLIELSKNEPCSNSRVAIKRIVGREGHMFKLENGRLITPIVRPLEFLELGVKRYKLIQTSLKEVELHYIPQDHKYLLDQVNAQSLIDFYLDPSLRVKPIIVNHLPQSSGGKQLMHESLIT
jgi:phenylacetate-CoA ligase